MGDLSKTSTDFFNRMRDNPAPAATPIPQSTWNYVLQYFAGSPEANAGPAQVMEPKPSPVDRPAVDPYMNFARKATGQTYK